MRALRFVIKVIKIIGLGGNFILRDFMAFFIARLAPEFKLVIIDGGSYKFHHRNHEDFKKPRNKALDSKDLLLSRFPNLNIEAWPFYVGRENTRSSISTKRIIQNGDVIFSCVDNGPSIQLISLRSVELQDIILIVAGVDGADILIQIYLKINGIELTKPIHERNVFVAKPDGMLPSEALRQDCLDTATQDKPNIFSLMLSGGLALSAFYSIKEHLDSRRIDRFNIQDIYFNISKMKMRIEQINLK